MALHELHARHLVLLAAGRSVTIWGPNKRVPRWIRQMIHQHRREILQMIGRSETVVCPAPELHGRWHTRFAGRQALRPEDIDGPVVIQPHELKSKKGQY